MAETEIALAQARPKETALIEAMRQVSITSAALAVAPTSTNIEEHLHAYEGAMRLIIEAELDAPSARQSTIGKFPRTT